LNAKMEMNVRNGPMLTFPLRSSLRRFRGLFHGVGEVA